ncbi:hypothetical protein EOD42_14230 [Rhodovarius crocodyli]|uniref:Uncharacterized protein n=1 Tax=Rhodovarius crocodyli TaxID=1979269 RepID=A0A437MF68_9PROT|nr:hypothetical protein [Rhodovarius crocodyli]RVT96266.1 hypothetical protein EOD42_14230 [Rhodovarius crocodyli]
MQQGRLGKPQSRLNVSVPVNGDTSDAVNCDAQQGVLRGLVTPGGFTGNITFEAGPPTTNGAPPASDWVPIYDAAGNQVTVTAGASRFIGFFGDVMAGVAWIRVKCSAAQAAGASIRLVFAR